MSDGTVTADLLFSGCLNDQQMPQAELVISNAGTATLTLSYYVGTDRSTMASGTTDIQPGGTVTIDDIWLSDTGTINYVIRYGDSEVADQALFSPCPETQLSLAVDNSKCDLSAYGLPFASSATVTLTNSSAAAYRYRLQVNGLDHGVVLDQVVEVAAGATVRISAPDLEADYYTASVREESSTDPQGFTWSNQEQLGTCRVDFDISAKRSGCYGYGAYAYTMTPPHGVVLRAYAGNEPRPEINGVLLGEVAIDHQGENLASFALDQTYRYTSLVLAAGDQTVLLDASESEPCSLTPALPTAVVSCKQVVFHNPAANAPVRFIVVPGANRGDGNLPPWADVTLAGGETRTVALPPDGDAFWTTLLGGHEPGDPGVFQIASGEMTELAQCSSTGTPSSPRPSSPAVTPPAPIPPSPDSGRPPLADTGSGSELGWVGTLGLALLASGVALVATGRRRFGRHHVDRR